jgi:hypothetical protein
MQTSLKLDATLADTTRLIWEDYEARVIDQDTADELIKEAFCFSGPVLEHFARELNVPSDFLAVVVIKSVPEQATRTQLRHIMSYIIPELRKGVEFAG